MMTQNEEVPSMNKVFLFAKTHSKKHVYSFEVQENVSIREILLLAKVELLKEDYSLSLELCSVHHVMTRRGRNFFEYAVLEPELSVEELIRRNLLYFCDRFLYVEVIERYAPPSGKFLVKHQRVTPVLARLTTLSGFASPEDEIAYELGQMYPMPLIIPDQLVKKTFNHYLDEKAVDYQMGFGSLDKVTPIAAENQKIVTSKLYYAEILMRVPKIVVYMFFPLFFVLRVVMSLVMYVYSLIGLTTPYFSKSTKKLHEIQPVCGFRLPLRLGLIHTMLESLLAFLLWKMIEQYFESIEKQTPSRIIIFIPLILYAFKIVLLGSTYLTSFEQILWYFRNHDQLGNDNHRFHYFFDEAFRADTADWAKGGYSRNSEAPQLFRIASELGVKFKPGFLYYIALFLKSFSPTFKLK